MDNYQYTAFISYRHVSPDADIAKKLHTLIETYAIPKDVQKKTGKKKMGRVFRDQEELPLSNDLGGDIYRALDNSEWLIVICSPRYLESKWCNAELDYFLSLGRRDHVLSLIVDGEKAASFPPQLLFEEVDGKKIPLEPLAGDVRAGSLKESLKKLQVEKLRIFAPMLDVNFDELRQRARRRRNRIIFSAAAVSFTLLSSFLIYALVKNTQIARQRDETMDNHMQLLIEQSNLASAEGNKLLAVHQLLEAEEVRETIGDRNDLAYSAALEYALYHDSFDSLLVIDNNNRKFEEMVFSYDDKYLLGITNLNSACLIDASTGKIRYTVSRSDIGQLDSVGFTRDDRYFYMVDSWYGFVSLYEVESGEKYREYDASDGMAWNIAEKVFALEDGKLLIIKDKAMDIWDYEKDESEEILPCGDGIFESYKQPLIVDLSPDGKDVVIGSHGYGYGMKIRSLDEKKTVDLVFDESRGYPQILYSGDGKRIGAVSGVCYYVWNAETGRLLLKGEVEDGSTGQTILLNEDGSILLLMDATYLIAVDVNEGRVLWKKEAESNIITEAYLSPDGSYLSCCGGLQGVYRLRDGEMICPDATAAFSHDGRMVLRAPYGSDPTLISTPLFSTVQEVDSFTEELYSTSRYTDPEEAVEITLKHNCSEIYSTPPMNASRKAGFYTSEDLKYVAYTHYDGFVEVFDLASRENIACMAEHCFYAVNDLLFHENLMASCGGYDARCVLFDLETSQIRYVLAASEYCHFCEFSKDGSKIIVISGYSADQADVYSTTTGNLLYHFEAGEGRSFMDAGFSMDGKTVAAIRSDSSAICGTLYTSIEEMVEVAKEE